jgi:hypothetical protein
MVSTATETADIYVSARHARIAWLLYFTKLTIEINGQQHVGAWGRRLVVAPPGWYEIRVFFPYFNKPRCGEATLTAEVAAGQRIVVEYRAPHLESGPGTIRIAA